MCNESGARFVRAQVPDLAGASVLEVGSHDVNGSVRPALEAQAATYTGVDIHPGPGVDVVCDVADLPAHVPDDSMDVVISTEMVEHVREWRSAFTNMKRATKPGGTLIVTTRSPGFKLHGHPYDFWRYTEDDMRAIFADFEIQAVEPDPLAPGIFVKAVKPADWKPADLRPIRLFSIVTGTVIEDVSDAQVLRFKARFRAHRAYRRLLPETVRASVKQRLRR